MRDKLLCNDNTGRGCVDMVLGVFYDLAVVDRRSQ